MSAGADRAGEDFLCDWPPFLPQKVRCCCMIVVDLAVALFLQATSVGAAAGPHWALLGGVESQFDMDAHVVFLFLKWKKKLDL